MTTMRILGEIKHPRLKITILHMNNRISIKFENGQYEQTYKFREHDAIKSLQDCERMVDAEMLAEVEATFQKMHQSKMGSFNRNILSGNEDEFETII